ncbi:MAG: ABC transporter ATP-binding protein [Gloeomargaritaceae cyanobacterium C42_A2020_066]|nr:ABC transporter ATP-binding protein [Gloeomargaritaceae cyanobacterium C42_A2020_066]
MAPESPAGPLLTLKDLRIRYPGQGDWAVQHVTLTLAAGRCLGLVGESGSGKSTIGRALVGLLPPGTEVTGSVQVAGRPQPPVSSPLNRRWRGETVGLVFQDPMTRLNPLLTIGEHYRETLQTHHSRLGRPAALQQGLRWLERVCLPRRCWDQYPHQLSGGMRQRAAIGLALLLDPPLVIADEPTTSLDVTVAAEILTLLRNLVQDRARGLLLISHDLPLVGTYCDQVAVLHRGEVVEYGEAAQVLGRPQHPYTQSLRQAAIALATPAPKPDLGDSPEPLLIVRHLSHSYALPGGTLAQRLGLQPAGRLAVVRGVDLTLYTGEILGLVGESGSGKSTLSRNLLQLVPPEQGEIWFEGRNLTGLAPRALRPYRQALQMIFQDPRACLDPRLTIGASVAEPLLIHGLATPVTAQAQVAEMLEQVGLTPAGRYLGRYPNQLSGGQLQRVAIARALITRPRLLVCDEPVSMLDVHIQAQVLALMLNLKQAFNLTYLFITHDLGVARFFCDRIAVIQKGQIVELGPTLEVLGRPQHPYTQQLVASMPHLMSAS